MNDNYHKTKPTLFIIIVSLFIISTACNLPITKPYSGIAPLLTATAAARLQNVTVESDIELADIDIPEDHYTYTAQSGDTILSLANRFQLPRSSFLSINNQKLEDSFHSTLPPGEIVIFHLDTKPEWFSLARIVPDNYFIYGLTQADFDAKEFIARYPGWLARFVETSNGRNITGPEILISTAKNYSISPRVLLALLENQLHALSDPVTPSSFSLGCTDPTRKTLVKHLSWAANVLNNGYYGWREGSQVIFLDAAGNQLSPNPESNAGSIAFHYYFSRILSEDELSFALSENGFQKNYISLFGEINWNVDRENPIFPENLQQPELALPLQPGLKWAYTGGPHSPWGTGYPLAAVDFAPPAATPGCEPSPYWVTAVSNGIITRSEEGILLQDLDGDGITQTGWGIQYLHLSMDKQLPVGTMLRTGEQIGHPSCTGGNSSGRHVHISRMYNGEWVPTGGTIPLELGGWVAINGEKEYKGLLTNGQIELRSSSVGEYFSQFPLK